MTDVFISYKREERDKAQSLAKELARHGFDVWWDVELLPGDRFADEIAAVIESAKAAVVLWSRLSVKSNFVRAEARAADKQGILIPARLDDSSPPMPFSELHTADLSDWTGQADHRGLLTLIRSIEQKTGKNASPVTEADTDTVFLKMHGADSEVEFWRAITEQAEQSPDEYRLYLQNFPQGMFIDLARLRIKQLERSKPKKYLLTIGSIAAAITAVIALLEPIQDLVVGTEAPTGKATNQSTDAASSDSISTRDTADQLIERDVRPEARPSDSENSSLDCKSLSLAKDRIECEQNI